MKGCLVLSLQREQASLRLHSLTVRPDLTLTGQLEGEARRDIRDGMAGSWRGFPVLGSSNVLLSFFCTQKTAA